MLQKRAEVLRTGSRASPIPQEASAPFTTVAHLLKRASSADLQVDNIRSFALGKDDSNKEADPKENVMKVKPRKKAADNVEGGKITVAKPPRKAISKNDTVNGEEKSKQPRKPRAKKVADRLGTDAPETVVPGKPRVKKADKEPNEDGSMKEKPARKPRAKKSEAGSQTKLARGKVTKSTGTKSKTSKAETNLETDKSAKESLEAYIADFGLAEAVKRRANWTPPVSRGKSTAITPLPREVLDSWLVSGESVGSVEGKKGFSDLLGNYGFINSVIGTKEQRPAESEVTRKRKLVELVKTNISTTGNISPIKEKAPKKKPRTITEQATSAYAEEEEDVSSKAAPLLQYLALQVADLPANNGFKVPPKLRSRSPVKAKAAKKGSAQAPILFSPESALKQARHQDYVFGTSSQLAREESPTLLRDLHEAMQASNASDGIENFMADPFFGSSATSLPNKNALTKKRNLWSAAARDSAGELMEVELIDMANSSPAVMKMTKPESRILTAPFSAQVTEEGWHDVDANNGDSPQKLSVVNFLGPIEAAIGNEQLSSSASNKLMKNSPKKGILVAKDAVVVYEIAKINSKSTAKSKTNKTPEMPNYSLYTSAQLSKELKLYGFKTIKKDSDKISQLHRCWEHTHRAALSALGTNTIVNLQVESPNKSASQATIISPKRARGRPRKDSTTTSPRKTKLQRTKPMNMAEDLEMGSDTPSSQIRTPKKSKKLAPPEDIDDSDAPVTPSPPRRQSSQIKTPPLPLRLSTADDAEAALSANSSQKLLFGHITRAIKTAERSSDPQNPSWHEKILMYDPIVLEELTLWLNTGALEKQGWDDEVEPKEVKKWCESKSICCLWRESLRNGARSRY